DLLGRLPAPSQAVLHAADGAIVRTVGVLLDVPRVQRAGIRGWAAGEDDTVTPSGKPLGTLPHVLATGAGLSPQRRQATPGRVDRCAERGAEAGGDPRVGRTEGRRRAGPDARREGGAEAGGDPGETDRCGSRATHAGHPPIRDQEPRTPTHMKFANWARRSTHSVGMSASSPPNCLQ